ncbi:hypothetical protein AB0L40_03680 [Patulibacter sp. NPDC049589]|uniref:YunG family protein n=1 Tax=Patulibacter sp. NPDC049589 TaxID=3154731 RepID=UPI00342221AA
MSPDPTHALPALADVEQALRASWSMETSDDPHSWSPENPALGQCAVSALVIRALFGGDIVIATVLDRHGERTPDGHAWNVLPSGEQVDFSFDQFLDGEGLGPEIVTEPVIDGDPQRAHLLASRVGNILGVTIDLPPNPLAAQAPAAAAAEVGPSPEGHWH